MCSINCITCIKVVVYRCYAVILSKKKSGEVNQAISVLLWMLCLWFDCFFSVTEETAGREQVQKVHHQTDQGSPVVQQKLQQNSPRYLLCH